MNEYFYRVWIPLQVATVIAFFAITSGYINLNWILILVSWFFIGPIGMGVGYHKLFAHRQFKTYKWIEHVLAVLGTLAAYSPLLFFAAQHQYHHKTSDSFKDPSSPVKYGFVESYLTWRLRKSVLKDVHTKNYPIKRIFKDRFLINISRNFTVVNYSVFLVLLMIDPFLLVNLYIIPVFIEHFRINCVSSFSHMKVPFSYRRHNTPDSSQNNFILGILTCGFGWHNRHHARPGEMLDQQRWWEIDIEGYVAWALNKIYHIKKYE